MTPDRDGLIKDIAAWLVEDGYPFNGHQSKPPVDELLVAICQEWAVKDNETYEDYADSIEYETGWKVPAQKENA